MRYLVVDPDGTALGFARRLLDEGAEVMLYTHPSWQRDVGLNLVPKISSLHAGLAWCKSKPGSIAFFTASGMGKAKAAAKRDDGVPVGADEFRKAGVTVVGGGSFCDRLEKDRAFGQQLAQAIGAREPVTKEFSSISQAIAFIKTRGDESWYFKSDRYLGSDATHGGSAETMVKYLEGLRRENGDRVANIMQKKVEGTALSTACWWNGQTFLTPFEGTIEHKAAWNEDIGPSTGAAISAVWFYESQEPKVVRSLHWENLEPFFRKYDAPPGLYDINAIIAKDDGEAYYLEWTPRLGFDSEPASLRLLDIPLADFLERLARGRLEAAPFSTKDLGFNTRLSVPPYPWEGCTQDKGSAKGVSIEGIDGLWDGDFWAYSVMMNDEGDLEVADRWGLVGLSQAFGRSLKECNAHAVQYAKKTLKAAGLSFRTDGDKAIGADAEALKKLGYDLPGTLFR